MAQAGRVLSEEESNELRGYDNRQLTRPEKFANVITDHTDVRGVVYRFPTAEEQKAADDSAKAAADAAQAEADMDKKVRAEAAKRSQQVVVPTKPQVIENA